MGTQKENFELEFSLPMLVLQAIKKYVLFIH